MRPNHLTVPPFLRLRPNRTAPFVVTCEHARHALPSGIATVAADRAALRTHWGWDPGAWDLTRAIARLLGTGATGGRWSRLWIDPRRGFAFAFLTNMWGAPSDAAIAILEEVYRARP